jgi:hypothetical protein
VLGRTTRAPTAGTPQPPIPPQGTPAALARILQQQAAEYRRAQQALDRHDLGAYQQAIERLGCLIEQARRLAGAHRLPRLPRPPARPEHARPAPTAA